MLLVLLKKKVIDSTEKFNKDEVEHYIEKYSLSFTVAKLLSMRKKKTLNMFLQSEETASWRQSEEGRMSRTVAR